LLSEDSYLLEGLESADKTKTHLKAKLQNTPTFIRNESHSCFNKWHTQMHTQTLFQWHVVVHTMQKRQSADTNVLNGR